MGGNFESGTLLIIVGIREEEASAKKNRLHVFRTKQDSKQAACRLAFTRMWNCIMLLYVCKHVELLFLREREYLHLLLYCF